MRKSTSDFTLEVEEVTGVCPAGEVYASQKLAEGKIPVFSCEGPCVRGDIARRAANRVSQEKPYARACYAETVCVPYSAMARWARETETVVVIDGCFLKCFGRILNNLIDKDKIIHIDALPLYRKYTNVFLMDDIPEAERQEVADAVAEKVLTILKTEDHVQDAYSRGKAAKDSG
jgi:uncharacterized metal-binding protein